MEETVLKKANSKKNLTEEIATRKRALNFYSLANILYIKFQLIQIFQTVLRISLRNIYNHQNIKFPLLYSVLLSILRRTKLP